MTNSPRKPFSSSLSSSSSQSSSSSSTSLSSSSTMSLSSSSSSTFLLSTSSPPSIARTDSTTRACQSRTARKWKEAEVAQTVRSRRREGLWKGVYQSLGVGALWLTGNLQASSCSSSSDSRRASRTRTSRRRSGGSSEHTCLERKGPGMMREEVL